MGGERAGEGVPGGGAGEDPGQSLSRGTPGVGGAHRVGGRGNFSFGMNRVGFIPKTSASRV